MIKKEGSRSENLSTMWDCFLFPLPFPLRSDKFLLLVCWRKRVQRPAASASISHMQTRIQNQTSQAHPPICFEAYLKGPHIGPQEDVNGCAPSVANTADLSPSAVYNTFYRIAFSRLVMSLLGPNCCDVENSES